jgi:hypothetical protein
MIAGIVNFRFSHSFLWCLLLDVLLLAQYNRFITYRFDFTYAITLPKLPARLLLYANKNINSYLHASNTLNINRQTITNI